MSLYCLDHLHNHIHAGLNCLENDASNTLSRFKRDEIRVIRKKLAMHAHTSVRVEEALAMAVILVAAVLLTLHDNHKNNFSTFSDERSKDRIGSEDAGLY